MRRVWAALRRRSAAPDSLTQSASLVSRVALLVGGGVSTHTVWDALAEDPSTGRVARRIEAARAAGASTPEALAQAGFTPLAAVWQVAEHAGAPMAEALRRLAAQLHDLVAAQRRRRVAFAGPAATMRLVMLLPVLGFVFSALLGFNAIGALVSSAVGWVVLVGGVLLIWAGRVWSIRLLNRAAGAPRLPGFAAELVATALSGGLGVDAARVSATDALDRYRVDDRALHEVMGVESDLARHAAFAARAGVPVAELLRAEADRERLDYTAEIDETAAKLGVTLMLPLGVCVLPAFILLSVVPMMLALVQQSIFS